MTITSSMSEIPAASSPTSRARKAVLPCGGLATRLLPATKSVPKELIPIVDRPIIHYLLDEVVMARMADALIVAGPGREGLTGYVGDSPELSRYLRDRSQDPLRSVNELRAAVRVFTTAQDGAHGMGHAVLQAASHIGEESFAVVTGDDLIDPVDPLLSTMVDVQQERGGIVHALVEVPAQSPLRHDFAHTSLTEQPGVVRIHRIDRNAPAGTTPGNLATIGRYLLPHDIFEVLAETPPDASGEVLLSTAVAELGRRGVPIHGVVFTGRRFDVGTKLGLLTTAIQLAVNREDLGPALGAWLRDFVPLRDCK